MSNGLSLGSLNRARYAGLDFDTHNDDLRARLQVKFAADFNDFAISSLGIMLLDLTAFGLDTLSFYLDRRATDTYLATARTRKSVSRACRQLGYKMGGAVASSVEVQAMVNQVYGFDVPIPKGFKLKGPNGLIFEVAEAVTFTIAEQGPGNSKPLLCYEGETIQETFTSDGAPAQVFELRRVPTDKYVVAGAVEVTVDGSPWDVVDLLEYGASDQFEVGFNDEPPTVRFGDGISGNIPALGASIVVTYVASRGKAGQVAAATITSVVTPLVVAFTQIPLTLTNPEGSVGGDDRETLASAKSFAPKVYKSRGVAVTGGDYEGLSGSYADPLFGRVAVAKAISSRSAATDLTVQNLLLDIHNAVDALNTSLTGSVSDINTALLALDSAAADVSNGAASITAHKNTIVSEAGTAITKARDVKNTSNEASVDASDIQDSVVAGKAAVDASSASAGEKTTIKNYFDAINTEALNIITACGTTIPNLANDVISDQNSILTETDGITTDVSDISTAKAIISAQSAIILAEAAAIDTANTDLLDTVIASQDGINTHLDKLLSADCKANLVTVPILARDAGGFYTAPTIGLIDSLQAFLDARKEVTHTISVTSGENFLVRAVVRIRVGVSPGYAESVVKTTVDSVAAGVLRGRQFGVSLYESDLDEVVIVQAGASFVITRILGHLDTDGTTILTTKLDSDGNLIISEGEVITLGLVMVETEPATT